jgi:mannose-P-dolichol utilization defect protein 1
MEFLLADNTFSQFVQQTIGKKCTLQLVQFNPDPTCLRMIVSKGLGLGIIAGASIVKLPQILKIVAAQSGNGVSLSSYLLESLSYGVTLAYNVRRESPFSTFGELGLIFIQNALVISLILYYSKRFFSLILALIFLFGATYSLFDPLLVNGDLLFKLQWASVFISIASRLPQIITNAQNKSTGQLSQVTTFFQVIGAAARVFTTLQEVSDISVLAGNAIATVLNAILFAQFLIYPAQVRRLDINYFFRNQFPKRSFNSDIFLSLEINFILIICEM